MKAFTIFVSKLPLGQPIIIEIVIEQLHFLYFVCFRDTHNNTVELDENS